MSEENVGDVEAVESEATAAPQLKPEEEGAIRLFSAAAETYADMAVVIESLMAPETWGDLDESGKQIVRIVHDTCASYLRGGSEALLAARGRLVDVLNGKRPGEELPLEALTQVSVPTVWKSTPQDCASWGRSLKKQVLERAAGELYQYIKAINDAVESLEPDRRRAIGDTHPYGDVIYGICLPYLMQAADLCGASHDGSDGTR